MNQLPDVNTGTTTSITSDQKDKQKIYWSEDTEHAVKQYLAIDHNHLKSKYDSYVKKKRESENYDPTIDDGYAAELQLNINNSLSEDVKLKKEMIFRSHIKVPLNKLIENIIFKFKLFRYDIDVKTLHNDCMSHVFEKFYKFDPDQNTKSFSYFGTIAKHYLQNRKKEIDALKSVNLHYEDHAEEVDIRFGEDGEESQASDEIIELFNHMIVVFENNMNNRALNENDRKVLDSILELFKSHSDADQHKGYKKKDVMDDSMYSKGNIFDFISDRSKLSKEDMSKSLTKLRNLYKEKRKDFYNKSDKN